MPIFKLSAPKTMRVLSGHIVPRNASNFTRSHLDLNPPPGRNPRTPAYMGGNGKGGEGQWVKGSLPLKRGGKKGRERGERRKVGEGKGQQQGGGSCSKVLGDRRPCMPFPIGGTLEVWNQASISNGFRDIQRRM